MALLSHPSFAIIFTASTHKMKKALLLLLALVPALCQSQEFRFAAHIGINPRTGGQYFRDGDIYALGARTLLGFKRIEAGLAFEAGKYSGKGINTTKYNSHFMKPASKKLFTQANYYSLSLIGNYKFPVASNIQLYSGALIGFDIGEAVRRDVYIDHGTSLHWHTPNSPQTVNILVHGLLTGIQVGARYHFNNTFALHGEVAARAPIYMEGFKYIAFYFPVTVGLSARLFGSADGKPKVSE